MVSFSLFNSILSLGVLRLPTLLSLMVVCAPLSHVSAALLRSDPPSPNGPFENDITRWRNVYKGVYASLNLHIPENSTRHWSARDIS